MKSTRTEDSGRVIWTNEQGQYHRVDGPAMEYPDGYKAWYLKGEPHRVDGPAIEWSNGNKYWYLNGLEYTEQEYNEEMLKIRLRRLLEL